MTDEARLSAGEFGTAFRGFLEQAVAQAPAQEPYFRRRLTEHFGVSPIGLPIVSEQFAPHEHVNLQLALESWVAGPGRAAETVGVSSEMKRMMGIGLGDLTAPARGGFGNAAPSEGPVDYVNLARDEDRKIPCLQFGLLLISDTAGPIALLVRAGDARFATAGVSVDVMAAERHRAEELLAELRDQMRRHNVYRSRIVSLSSKPPLGTLEVKFHRLPEVDRADIILPDGVLERIERQTIVVSELRDRLLAAGRHLKRGLLLWGPPGTGKTLTAMYLARQMPDRTVLVLTGQTLGLIETSCAMARLLEPATVILEDVDLVAEERTRQGTGTNAVLFELLNQMDGLSDDADILFILTSNRPELLEPALASRPGRIDAAVEIPLPDVACRARLLELYGRGLNLSLRDAGRIVDRLEGVSAAFIKELLRKAALLAAQTSDGAITVTDEELDNALLDLAVEGGDLTKSVLGASQLGERRPDC